MITPQICNCAVTQTLAAEHWQFEYRFSAEGHAACLLDALIPISIRPLSCSHLAINKPRDFSSKAGGFGAQCSSLFFPVVILVRRDHGSPPSMHLKTGLGPLSLCC